VAVSPFFNPLIKPGEPGFGDLDPGCFATVYCQFLEHAGIDIVMLQDGVGTRGLKTGDLPVRVIPYFQAFQQLCRSKHVALWGNVENFEIVPGQPNMNDFWPTDIGRLESQIRATAPFVKELVTFDFFHYMNPYGYLHEDQSETVYRARERVLYNAYKNDFAP
jgi:hypothetical protein